ncbi:three-prime repair exonuclease 1-like [Branchiostoma floridae]|uniref:Three-prime repair exonuclease 1-like n=2 Tax=Branchiostoma floridae TaxID=7739 RepID=A0A9J7N9N6_BRAFL|nr:three-prime repair exonuclease 1-like [Branchiostoma floridae]
MSASLVKAEKGKTTNGKKEEATKGSTKAEPAPIQTFVFFDLETTGLDQPRQITEISLAAVRRDQLLTGTTVPPGGATIPRVMDKFTVCVRPRRDIHPKAAEITNLTNQTLGKHRVFDEDLVKSVVHLLNRQEPPVCLVAHNGNRFDFPILKAELGESETVDLFPQDVLCVDTMVAIKDLYAGQFKSFSLPKIHETLFGEAPPPEVAHTAEGDVITMVKIVKKLGAKEILQWMDSNAVSFAI